jgi:hypothetical protein
MVVFGFVFDDEEAAVVVAPPVFEFPISDERSGLGHGSKRDAFKAVTGFEFPCCKSVWGFIGLELTPAGALEVSVRALKGGEPLKAREVVGIAGVVELGNKDDI